MISQTIHWAGSALFWIALALVLIGVFKRNLRSATLCSNGKVQFAPRWWFVCAWAFILVRFGFTGTNYLRSGLKEPLQFVTGALIWVAVIGAVLSIPGILVVTNEALEEVNWVWRNKRIRWSEIQEIQTEKRGSAVTVVGSGRSKIVYTNIYPDRPRFLLEIKRHCSDNLPPNFPDEKLSSDAARCCHLK
jgi:hypothetical protein